MEPEGEQREIDHTKSFHNPKAGETAVNGEAGPPMCASPGAVDADAEAAANASSIDKALGCSLEDYSTTGTVIPCSDSHDCSRAGSPGPAPTASASCGGGGTDVRCHLQLQTLDDGASISVSIQLGAEEAEIFGAKGTQQNPHTDSEPASAEDVRSASQYEPQQALAAVEPAVIDLVAQQVEQLKALQEERQHLMGENQRLQRFARQYIDAGSKASKQSMADVSSMAGIEHRYVIGLQQLQKLWAQQTEAEARAERLLEPEKERLAAAQGRVAAHRQAFLGFLAQVAEALGGPSASGGAGKGTSGAKAMKTFLEVEPAKVEEVTALRLRNAELQHRIASLEQRLKDSDRLSDGLHLIDFEQLKIENSTLSYKIEVRSAEVLKLRTKLTQTIQISAHAKEKLHCAAQEKRCLESRLQTAEAQMQRRRLELAAGKARREQLLGLRAELQQGWSIVSDRRCLADMKAQEAKLVELQKEVHRLQHTYESLKGLTGRRS